MFDLSSIDIGAVIIVALVAIIAITFHEAAHGFVAWRLGDPTAYQQGRVSFNPLRHIDPVGTVLLPIGLYIMTGWMLGWAKPVPVTPSRLDNPRRDMVLVAAAGPGINFALALASGILLALWGGEERDFVARLLFVSIYFNVLIAVFNLMPIPPLDGGRIAVGLLPGPLAYPLQRLEPYGMFIVIGLLLIVPLVTRQLGSEINLFTWIVQPVVGGIVQAIDALTGARLLQ